MKKNHQTDPVVLDKVTGAAREAARELADSRRVRIVQEMKDFARRTLGRKTAEKDLFFWPCGILCLGLAEDGSPESIAAIREHVSAFKKNGAKLLYPDDALMGAALIRTQDQLIRAAALKDQEREGIRQAYELSLTVDLVYRMVTETDRDELGSILYRPGRGHTEILADGAGMTALFLAKYAESRFFFDPDNNSEETAVAALELAITQLYNFSSFAEDEASGLLWHCYEAKADGALTRKGLIGWGRAMGWYLMGLSAVVCAMEALGLKEEAEETEAAEGTEKEQSGASAEEEQRGTLAELLKKYMEAVFSHQREDGLFPWCLTDLTQTDGVFSSVTADSLRGALTDTERREEGDPGQEIQPAAGLLTDTSASAMIGWAALKAMQAGLLDAELYKARLERLREGLLKQISPEGVVSGALAECDGFGLHPQKFGSYPWGQGAALAFLRSTGAAENPET